MKYRDWIEDHPTFMRLHLPAVLAATFLTHLWEVMR